MKGLEEMTPSEETEKRGPQAGDEIEILIARIDIQEIKDGIAYFFHAIGQLKVSIDKLIPTEWGGWKAKDLQEIHAVDPGREAIWQKFAQNCRDDLADVFPKKIKKDRRGIRGWLQEWL